MASSMDAEPGPQATIRREVIEYGALPIAAWLHHIDGAAAVQTLLRQLVEVAETDGAHCARPPSASPPLAATSVPSVVVRNVRHDLKAVLQQPVPMPGRATAVPRLHRASVVLRTLALSQRPRRLRAGLVDIATLASCLDVPQQHAQVGVPPLLASEALSTTPLASSPPADQAADKCRPRAGFIACAPGCGAARLREAAAARVCVRAMGVGGGGVHGRLQSEGLASAVT